MQRRHFSLATATAATSLTLGLSPAFAQFAAAGVPQEGKQYRRLSKPAPVDAPAGKVEVVEFFWYSCPHCSVFEPVFAAWKAKAPQDVVVSRVPVAYNASFVPQQKLYYALQAMDNFEAMHVKAFHTIHVERNRLLTDQAIFDWVAKQGVDVEKFKEIFNSFNVASQVRKATALQQAYDVEGVPSIGVAGRYYTDGPMAGGMPNVLQVMDYLIAESAKAVK